MVNYKAADFLIRLKNAQMAGLKKVDVDTSKFIRAIADVLKDEGFLDKVEEKDGTLSVTLSMRKKESVLLDVKIVSRPGLRVYKTLDQLRKKRGAAVYIISTSKGVMSDKKAVKQAVGGELVAEIY